MSLGSGCVARCQVVEVGVRLRVHQDRGVEEDGEGQVGSRKEEGRGRSCVKIQTTEKVEGTQGERHV